MVDAPMNFLPVHDFSDQGTAPQKALHRRLEMLGFTDQYGALTNTHGDIKWYFMGYRTNKCLNMEVL